MRFLLGAASAVAALGTVSASGSPSGCSRVFTVAETEHAIDRDFRGARNVTASQTAAYRHMIRCQRFAYNRPKLRRYLAATVRAWRVRRYNAANPIQYATASWYYDQGSTACGFHARYGVASPDVAYIGPWICGRHVEFYFDGRSVIATVDDAGPFIAGRSWDLGESTAGALGFSGVQTVGYRPVR
jgi:rare lipoprotein A (peptidoglycan hydrolase)